MWNIWFDHGNSSTSRTGTLSWTASMLAKEYCNIKRHAYIDGISLKISIHLTSSWSLYSLIQLYCTLNRNARSIFAYVNVIMLKIRFFRPDMYFTGGFIYYQNLCIQVGQCYVLLLPDYRQAGLSMVPKIRYHPFDTRTSLVVAIPSMHHLPRRIN